MDNFNNLMLTMMKLFLLVLTVAVMMLVYVPVTGWLVKTIPEEESAVWCL